MSGPVEVDNPFDLTKIVAGDDLYLVGYVTVVKTLTPEGEVAMQYFTHEMNTWEAVGVLQAQIDRLRSLNAGDFYVLDEDDDQEE